MANFYQLTLFIANLFFKAVSMGTKLELPMNEQNISYCLCKTFLKI